MTAVATADPGSGWRQDAAFGRFYEQHYRQVLAYCRRRVGPSAAEDASAEVFAAAWRKWPSVPTDERALPWLYGAAHREVLHQWRSAARYRRLVDRARHLGHPPAHEPDQVVVRGVEAELACRALLRLPRRDQEILRLAVWEELRHSDIAVVLGLSVEAVGMRLVRAKRRFGREYRTLEAGPAHRSRAAEMGGEE